MSDRLIEGDHAKDARGNVGIVRKCFNQTMREHFLSVEITSGPDKRLGSQITWGKAYRFWPELDQPGGTVKAVCEHCERVFLSKPEPKRTNDPFEKAVAASDRCRTCAPPEKTAAQRERERIEHASGEYARKTQHHATSAEQAAKDDGAGFL